VTRGFLCGKVARYLEREYSPERLLYPLRRTGAKGEGRFARITWMKRSMKSPRVSKPSPRTPARSHSALQLRRLDGLLAGLRHGPPLFSSHGRVPARSHHLFGRGRRWPRRIHRFKYGTEPEQFRHSRLILAWARIFSHQRPPVAVHRRSPRQGARSTPSIPIATAPANWRQAFLHQPRSDTALALA